MKDRLKPFTELSGRISQFLAKGSDEEFDRELQSAIQRSFVQNGWFTEYNVRDALFGISEMLEASKLEKWLGKYDESEAGKKVGIIMAGNIPLVGFHDFLCVILSGNDAVIKMSSQDSALLPVITNFLSSVDPRLKERISFVEKLSGHEAVIATGSNNSARYFEYYFRNIPHIIRKNRNSIAVLTGDESEDELKALGSDIFRYFGLGCRNVSKVMLPEGYDLDRIFRQLVSFGDVIQNKKYANNYDYYKAYYIMNKADLLENGFLMMMRDESLHSPVSMLFYDFYKDHEEVDKYLKENESQLQCVVSKADFIANPVPFGKSQMPEPWDYADGVDTMEFLGGVNR